MRRRRVSLESSRATAGALKSAGVDIRKTRNVVFQSGALAITAMLGGHIEIAIVFFSEFRAQYEAGAVRPVALAGRILVLPRNSNTKGEAGCS